MMIMTGIALVVDISCCHRATFRFFRVVLRGRLIGAGLDPVDGSIYKPLTRVQITHAASFFFLPLSV